MTNLKINQTRKAVDLDQKIIDLLAVQAIELGHRNFKNYAELLLTAQAYKTTIDQLKNLSK